MSFVNRPSRALTLIHILKQSMALSIMGSFAGLVVATAAVGLLKSFLFEINPVSTRSPFCAVPILMLLLASSPPGFPHAAPPP
jgi:hypothetical protein